MKRVGNIPEYNNIRPPDITLTYVQVHVYKYNNIYKGTYVHGYKHIKYCIKEITIHH